MAHAEGWIEAYELLDLGRSLPRPMEALVLHNRNGLGETMLHWYAIEGAVEVVERLIDLGFDVNTTNNFSKTPLFECVQLGRWEMVALLLRRGADPGIKDHCGEDIFEHLADVGDPETATRLREFVMVNRRRR